MWQWLLELDRILRGDATRLSALRDGTIEISARRLIGVLIVLAMIYGACMGSFSLLKSEGQTYYMQIVATTLKVPALFFLTLAITCPSLYVFNALVGSRLDVASLMRLLVAALAVNLAVLASLGPIVAFFSVSTTSYPFMVLLNVLVFAVSGLLGLIFLLQTLNRITVAGRQPPPTPTAPEPAGDLENDLPDEPVTADVVPEPGALDRIEGHVLGRHVKTVFNIWVLVFALVGAQMGWILRPFIGDPGLPFEWIRARQSNFFEAVIRSFMQLFS